MGAVCTWIFHFVAAFDVIGAGLVFHAFGEFIWILVFSTAIWIYLI